MQSIGVDSCSNAPNLQKTAQRTIVRHPAKLFNISNQLTTHQKI